MVMVSYDEKPVLVPVDNFVFEVALDYRSDTIENL